MLGSITRRSVSRDEERESARIPFYIHNLREIKRYAILVNSAELFVVNHFLSVANKQLSPLLDISLIC